MEEKEIQFRTAAFGGFQKQDVLDYLEKSAREHADEMTALRRELSSAQTGKSEAEKQQAQLEERMRALEEENRQLSDRASQAEERAEEMTQSRGELEEQVRQLQAKVEELTPASAAYESLKDRTATIELEAHGRARAIEMGAHEKLKKSQSQLTDWLEKVQASYDRLRANLDDSLTRAEGELDRVRGGLDEISGQFREHDEALKSLKSQVESLEGPKAPLPLPLEEEHE